MVKNNDYVDQWTNVNVIYCNLKQLNFSVIILIMKRKGYVEK